MRNVLVLLFAALQTLAAATYDADPTAAEELRARDGLGNVLAKAAAGKPVRIAYLGGSITAAAGWRPKSLAWFQSQFPQASFSEINAAISGTGSDYGACRVQLDVLDHKPDLVFLECRVNGGGGFEKQSVEGIVRRIWTSDPSIDICFIYTISQWMLKDIQAGKAPAFGAVMEGIANHYGIPSIDFGVEIARREKAGELIFKAAQPIPGTLVFSQDGTHPGDAGYEVYRDVLARSVLAMKDVGTARPHALPAPLVPHPWEVATLLPISQATLSAEWTAVDMAKDPVLSADLGRTRGMLREARRCDTVGATLTVHFDGTALGISDVPATEPIVIEAIIDGQQKLTRSATEHPRKYARFWYTPELRPGPHTVTYTITALPPGTACYLGQLLVVGIPAVAASAGAGGK